MLKIGAVKGLEKGFYGRLMEFGSLPNGIKFPAQHRQSRGPCPEVPLTVAQHIDFMGLKHYIQPEPSDRMVIEPHSLLREQMAKFCGTETFVEIVSDMANPEALKKTMRFLESKISFLAQPIRLSDRGHKKAIFLYHRGQAPFVDENMELVDFQGRCHRVLFQNLLDQDIFTKIDNDVWLHRLKNLFEFWKPGAECLASSKRAGIFTSNPALRATAEILGRLAPSNTKGLTDLLQDGNRRLDVASLLDQTQINLFKINQEIFARLTRHHKFRKDRATRAMIFLAHHMEGLQHFKEFRLYGGHERPQDYLSYSGKTPAGHAFKHPFCYTLPMAISDFRGLLAPFKKVSPGQIPDIEQVMPAALFMYRELWPFMDDLIFVINQFDHLYDFGVKVLKHPGKYFK